MRNESTTDDFANHVIHVHNWRSVIGYQLDPCCRSSVADDPLVVKSMTKDKVFFGRPSPFLGVRHVSDIRVFHPWLVFEVEVSKRGVKGE